MDKSIKQAKSLNQKIAEALPLFIERDAYTVLENWREENLGRTDETDWQERLTEVFLKLEGLDRAVSDLIVLAEGHQETEGIMKTLSEIIAPILAQIPRRSTVARAARDLAFSRIVSPPVINKQLLPQEPPSG